MSLKIIICDKCEGWGKIQKDELTDYHHRYYDTWEERCDKCEGHGRLVEETSTKFYDSRAIISETQVLIKKLNQDQTSIKGRN